MKTNDLIANLASGAGPAKRLLIGRDLALVGVSGLLFCSAISLGVRGLVPEMMWTGVALWTKLAYAMALAASSAWLLYVLAYPGKSALSANRTVFVVGIFMAAIGIVSVLNVPNGEKLSYLMGHYALTCPWAIPLLSLPTLGGLLQLAKRFAPTDLRWTGFATGLLAGSIAAAGYALSCREEAIGFVAVWYSLGILLSAGLGAAAAPRLLRW
jgi:hypothetical protein